MCVCVSSHREPPAYVSDEEVGVVVEVAHHGVTATQLCGTTIMLMVITHTAVPHHGQHEGEDPLERGGGRYQ